MQFPATSATARAGLALLRLAGPELACALRHEAERTPGLILRDAAGAAPPDAAAAALKAGLLAGLAAARLPAEMRALAVFLVGELSADGMLDVPLSEIASELGVTPALAEGALHAVQAAGPAGVAARSLAECLWLQLVARGQPPDLARAAIDRLDLFARRRWGDLEAALQLPAPRLRHLAEDIGQLSALPAGVAGPPAGAPPRAADLVLHRGADGRLQVGLAAVPWVGLAPLPRGAAIRDLAAQAARAQAETVIAALAFRQATLLSVGEELVRRQRDFLVAGGAGLRPLSRTDLALTLGLHPATVSRAVAGKAIEADGKLLWLESFFSQALASSGGDIAVGAVQHRIRRMVERESSRLPLSDAAIRALLLADGVDIARRTVAKYRKCMRIPSSFERRRRAPGCRPSTAGSRPDAG